SAPVPESWGRGDVLSYSAQNGPRFSLRVFSFRDKAETAFETEDSAIPPQSEFSPDGQWIVYHRAGVGPGRSNSLPRIYVQPFPAADGITQISGPGGGIKPMWSRDGREIFYALPASGSTSGTWFAVSVQTHPSFTFRKPASVPTGGLLIGTPGQGQNLRNYDIGPDGRR